MTVTYDVPEAYDYDAFGNIIVKQSKTVEVEEEIVSPKIDQIVKSEEKVKIKKSKKNNYGRK